MPESTAPVQRGTTLRVRRSMLSMFVGKPISAIAGLLLLVLLSRYLDPVDYGGYFVVLAVAEIFILASNFGLMPAATRYLGAHQLETGELLPYGPVRLFVALRILTLVGSGILIFYFSVSFSAIAGGYRIVPLLAAIIVGEGLARFIEIILDSMFCQGRSQFGVVLRTLIRLGGVGYLIAVEKMDLYNVVLVEAIACGIGGGLSLALLSSIYLQRKRFSLLSDDHSSPELSRVLNFALPAFVAQVLGIAYGPDIMKLVLGGRAGQEALAAFGFAFSIVAVVQRYMPATLFAGIFRPVFVSASKRADGSRVLSDLVNLSIKMNWFFIFSIAIMIHVVGDAVLSHVSKGNYPASGSILFILLLVVATISVHLTFSMYSLAIERSMAPLYATALAGMSLPIGFVLADYMGAEGIAVSLLAGETIWCASCLVLMGTLSHRRPRLDWQRLGLFVLAFVLSLLASNFLLSVISSHPYVIAVFSVFLFFVLILLFRVISPQEFKWVCSVLPVDRLLGRSKA